MRDGAQEGAEQRLLAIEESELLLQGVGLAGDRHEHRAALSRSSANLTKSV